MNHTYELNTGECGAIDASGRPEAVRELQTKYGSDLRSVNGIDVPAAEQGQHQDTPDTSDLHGWDNAFAQGEAR